MTPKERAAMQQALEAMIAGNDEWPRLDVTEAIIALREALDHFRDATKKVAEQAEQDPVAWMDNDGNVCDNNDFGDAFPIPLYAAPVRTKDLTDDEIYTLYSEPCSDREMVEFARAVIAADREKNRG